MKREKSNFREKKVGAGEKAKNITKVRKSK